MTEYHLGQTLIVTPETSFDRIAAAIEKIGWRRENPGLAAPPIVSGEPEMATWTWNGHKPFVVYTFNPVVRLRVLDVATAPPVFRKIIADNLPLIEAEQISNYLTNTSNPRKKLLGLWAAQETERIDLATEASYMEADPEPLVSEQAGSVALRLKRITQARIEVLSNLHLLSDAAGQLIERLSDVKFVQGLCPTRKDCEKLFDKELAGSITESALLEYQQLPKVAEPGERYSKLEITAAPAGLLRTFNELSERFPRGYRNIAGWMKPSRIWLTWAYKAVDGGAVRYDGLAWLDDHWIWLPKPFRIIAPLIVESTGSIHRTVHL